MVAQSSVFIRNNSWLDFDIKLVQNGSHSPNAQQYNHNTTLLSNWIEDTEVFNTLRDSAVVPIGDSVIYSLALSHGLDTVWFDLRMQRSGPMTTVASRLHGNTFDTGYSADGSFHLGNISIAGRTLTFQYKADNDDTQQSLDIRLAIHESPIYAIDSADFSNPNVLNVMAYNIQMLPLGVVGMPQADDRADLLPAQFSPWQDVVIFEEAFDPLPRLQNLEPAMLAAGYAHNSGILNDYFPFNGGVIIFSKWPIEATDQYDFELCGPSSQDCLANKGIKYARINKLGKYYNVFGTHFDAGSDAPDLEAKNLQYTEMKNFIAAQNIPQHEAVIWGGDLNTDANNSHNLYYNMLDSIDIVVPDYSGFFESNFGRDTGDVIDHVFTDPRYLLPLEGQVFITTFRSLSSVLWDLSEFSDHRSAIARFRFPDLSVTGGDQVLCPGESLSFSSTADIPVQRIWYHNGLPMAGVVGPGIAINATTLSDSGLYELEMRYAQTYGTGQGPIDLLLYPNGPVTRTANIRMRAGLADISLANCPIAAPDPALKTLQVFPNPANTQLHLQRESQVPLVWELKDLRGINLQKDVWTAQSLTIDLTQLPQGIYILHLTGKNGTAHHEKIMVAR